MRFPLPPNWGSAGSGSPKGTGSIKAMGLFCKFHSHVARMVRAATMIGRSYGFLISSAAMHKIDVMGSRIRVWDRGDLDHNCGATPMLLVGDTEQ
jgi:hypothetical protein